MIQAKNQEKSTTQLDELLLYAMNCYHNGHYEKALTTFQIIALNVKVIQPSLWLSCAACLAEIGHVSECIIIIQYVCSQQLNRELRLEALTIVVSAILNEALCTRNTQHLLQLETYLFELRAIDEKNPLIFIGYTMFFIRTYSLTMPGYFTNDYIDLVTSQSLLAEFYRARLLHAMGNVSAANELYEKVYQSSEILCRDPHGLQYEHYKALYNAALEGYLITEIYDYFMLRGRIEACSLGYIDLPDDDRNVCASVDGQQEDPRLVHKSAYLESQISKAQTRIHMCYTILSKNGVSLAPNIILLVSLIIQSNDILVNQVSGSINPLLTAPILHLNRFSYSNAKDLVLAIGSTLSYLLLTSTEQKTKVMYIRLIDHPGHRSILNSGARTAMNDLRWHEFPCFATGSSHDDIPSLLTPFVPLELDVFLCIVREGHFEDSFSRTYIMIFPELFYNISLIALRALDYPLALLFLSISIYASAVSFALLSGNCGGVSLLHINEVKEHLITIESAIKLFYNSPDIIETRPDILKIILHAPLDTCYALCHFLQTFGFTRAALHLAISLSHLYFTPKLSIFVLNLLRAEGVPPIIQTVYLFGPRATAAISISNSDPRTIWNHEILVSIHPRLLAYLALLVDPTDQSESISVYQKALSTSIKAQEKNKINQLFCETAMIYLVAVKICYYMAQKYIIRNLHSDFGKEISLFNRIAQDNDDVIRFLTKLMVGLNEKLANYEKIVDYYYKDINRELFSKHKSLDYSPIVFNLKTCISNLTCTKAALCGIYNQSLVNITCLLNHISSPASCDRKTYMGYTFTTGCIYLAQNNIAAASYFQNALVSGLLMRILPRPVTDQSNTFLLSMLKHMNDKYDKMLRIYELSAHASNGLMNTSSPITSQETDLEIRIMHPVIPLSLLLYLIVSLHSCGNHMECLSILKTLLLQYPLPKYPLLSSLLVTVLDAVIAPMIEHNIGGQIKRLQIELRKIVIEQHLDAEKEYLWLFANQSHSQSKSSDKAVLLEIKKAQQLCDDLNSIMDMPTNDVIMRLMEKYTEINNTYNSVSNIREEIVSMISAHLEIIGALKVKFSAQLDSLTDLYKHTAQLFQLSKQDVELCIMYLDVLNSMIQETASFSQGVASTVGSESLFLNDISYPWLAATYPRFLSKIGASKSTFSMFLSSNVDYNSHNLEMMSDRYGVPVYTESFIRSYMSIQRVPLIRKIKDCYRYYAKELENINKADALVKHLKDIEKTLIKTIISCQTVVRNAKSVKSAVKLDIYTIAKQNNELMRRNEEAIELQQRDHQRYSRSNDRVPRDQTKKQRPQHHMNTGVDTTHGDEYLWDVQNTEIGVGSDGHESTSTSLQDNVYRESNNIDSQVPFNARNRVENDLQYESDDI